MSIENLILGFVGSVARIAQQGGRAAQVRAAIQAEHDKLQQQLADLDAEVEEIFSKEEAAAGATPDSGGAHG